MTSPPYKSKLIGLNLSYASNEEEVMRLVQSSVKVILVVSNVIGKLFIQNIENGLEKCNNIYGAVCYCFKREDNIKFFEKYSLVKHVENDKNVLIERIFKLREDAFKGIENDKN